MSPEPLGPGRYDPTRFRSVFEQQFTYLNGFRRNVHRYASRRALQDPRTGRSWTYRELGQAVDELAAGLAGAGVGPGDVVTYQLFNGPEFALLYLATQTLGAIGSPINFRLSPGETAHILDDSEPAVYVYDTDLVATAGQALAMAKHRPALTVAVRGDSGADPLTDSARFDDLPVAGASVAAAQVSVYDETTRLYTSGTTGLPKGVPLNSLVEVLSAHDVIMHFPLSPEDRTMNMTPWFHRGGLYSGGPNPVFYVGAQAIPLRRFDPGACLDAVADYGLTFLIGAPTVLESLTTLQQRDPRDLSSLRGIVTMGAPLSRDACLRYQRVLTPNIFNGYGTSEAFWNTFLRPVDLPERAGSAGRACTDDDVAVVKVFAERTAEPHELAAKDGKEIGEVIVRSPKSAYAYVNHPEEEEAVFRQGWLYIGDLATWDEDEYVTIVGRKDDMIISGGENIHPVQVEAVLNEHPSVSDSVVVGAPDDRWGQLVVAYVRPERDAPSAEDLDRFCREHPMLADYKRPRAYRFVDELPYTATGKKLHYVVKEWAVDDTKGGSLERPS